MDDLAKVESGLREVECWFASASAVTGTNGIKFGNSTAEEVWHVLFDSPTTTELTLSTTVIVKSKQLVAMALPNLRCEYMYNGIPLLIH